MIEPDPTPVDVRTSDADTTLKPSPPKPGERWAQGSQQLQDTVKWLVTALAAVGAVLFAKGLVTVPKLDVVDNLGQLLFAWLLGVVGVLGIAVLIWSISKILIPQLLTIGSLPAQFESQIKSNPGDYLPSGASSIEEFRSNLRTYRAAVWPSRELIKELDQQLSALSGASEKDTDAIERATQNLAAAQGGSKVLEENLRLYLECRDDLLNRAEFWAQSNTFATRARPAFAGAVLAAIGGIGFQLALSTPAEPKQAAATPSPRVATLTLTGAPGAEVWTSSGLAKCVSPKPQPVKVLVTGGSGAANDPYELTTLTDPGCPDVSFSIINDVGTVVFQGTIPDANITYRPSPSPTQ